MGRGDEKNSLTPILNIMYNTYPTFLPLMKSDEFGKIENAHTPQITPTYTQTK